MRIFLTVILSLAIIRGLNTYSEMRGTPGAFTGTLIMIAAEIIGIIFVWSI